jgi:hypothetical protein
MIKAITSLSFVYSKSKLLCSAYYLDKYKVTDDRTRLMGRENKPSRDFRFLNRSIVRDRALRFVFLYKVENLQFPIFVSKE